MGKESIIIFDDDEKYVSDFGKGLASLSVGLEVIGFNNIRELRVALSDRNIMANVRCMIFDLAKSNSESQSQDHQYDILEDIKQKYETYRMPIFIHSAFSEYVTRFEGCGTVFMIAKDGESVKNICTKIKLFFDSGFFEIFCEEGIIEKAIMRELHSYFVGQFKNNEIASILESVQTTSKPEEFKTRSIEILKRISVKALMSGLLAPVVVDKTDVNPIEHYYRRISSLKYWTGDIYCKKNKTESVIILTPRCDLAQNNSNELFVCVVEKCETQAGKITIKEINNQMRDNNQGKAVRVLPKAPVFEGGKVMLSNYKTINKEQINDTYDYVITLSDDLTNELIGKLCSVFLRTGIYGINPYELNAYFEKIQKE